MRCTPALTVLFAGAATLSIAMAQQTQPSTQPTTRPSQPGMEQPDRRPGQPGQPGQPGMPDRTTGRDAQQSPDRDFVSECIRHSLFETELSRHVAQTAQDTQVRQYAERLADFHEKHTEDLRQLAQQLGYDAPDSMHNWQTEKLNQIRTMPPAQLDHKYIFHEVGANTTAELGFQYVINKGQEQQVKQQAQDSLKEIRTHKQQAEQIARKIAGGGASGLTPMPRTNTPDGRPEGRP
jgi:predicted outer membrane protein